MDQLRRPAWACENEHTKQEASDRSKPSNASASSSARHFQAAPEMHEAAMQIVREARRHSEWITKMAEERAARQRAEALQRQREEEEAREIERRKAAEAKQAEEEKRRMIERRKEEDRLKRAVSCSP